MASKMRYNGNIEFAKLDRQIVLELAAKHLLRYSQMIELAVKGDPGYNLEELHVLHAVWTGIHVHDGEWNSLGEDAKQEVLDALYDEGYE